jgi:hypothetical protein
MAANGSCPKGYHPRVAYTVKRSGRRVGAACVRATTKRETRRNFLKRTRERMTIRLRAFRKSRRGPTSCTAGKIVRDPYVRVRLGQRQYVPAACVKDMGNPGKGIPSGAPGIGPLRKGNLRRFGYTDVRHMSESRRHMALAAAVKVYGSLTVWRKLNAVYIYTKKTSPASSQVFKADRDWIKARFGIKAF